MDTVKVDNETELTSTMGNVLSTSINDEKSDTGDATPTSSTDASTTTISARIVSDDPISSTSSDVIEQMKPKTSVSAMSKTLDEDGKVSSMDQEADLLEMSMTDVTVSNEKITEDVEDLVHDLESLLGESTELYSVSVKQQKDGSSTSPETLSSDNLTENENDKEPHSPKSDNTMKEFTEKENDNNIQGVDKLTNLEGVTVAEESSNTIPTCIESEKVGDGVENLDLCQESSQSEEKCNIKDKDTGNSEFAHSESDTVIPESAIILNKEKCDREIIETNLSKLEDAKVAVVAEEPPESVGNKEICDLKDEDDETDTVKVESLNMCQNVIDGSDIKIMNAGHGKLSEDKSDNCAEKQEKSDIKAENTDNSDISNATNETLVQECLENEETPCAEETPNQVLEIVEKDITPEDPVDNIVSDVHPDTSHMQKDISESFEPNINDTSLSEHQEIADKEEHCVDEKNKVSIRSVEGTISSDIDTAKEPQLYSADIKESCSDTIAIKSVPNKLENEATLNEPNDDVPISIDETPLENPEIEITHPEESSEKQEESPDIGAVITECETEVMVESENVDTSEIVDNNSTDSSGIIIKEDQPEFETSHVEHKNEVKTLNDTLESGSGNSCERKDQNNSEFETGDNSNPKQHNYSVEEIVEDENDQTKFEETPMEANAEVELVQDITEIRNQHNSDDEIDNNISLKEQINSAEENVEDDDHNNCENTAVEDNSEIELVQCNPEVEDQHNEEVRMQHDTDLPNIETVEDNLEAEEAEEENVEDDSKIQTADEIPKAKDMDSSNIEIQHDLDLKDQDNQEVATEEDNREVEVIENDSEKELVHDNPVETNSDVGIIQDKIANENILEKTQQVNIEADSEVVQENSIKEIILENLGDGNVGVVNEVGTVANDIIENNCQGECQDVSELQSQDNSEPKAAEIKSIRCDTDGELVQEAVSEESKAETETVTYVDNQEGNVSDSSEMEGIPKIEASLESSQVLETENAEVEDRIPITKVDDKNISLDTKNIEEDTLAALEIIPNLKDTGEPKEELFEESEIAPTKEEVGVEEDLNSIEKTNEVAEVVPELNNDESSTENKTGTESAIVESFVEVVDCNTSKLCDATATIALTEEKSAQHELSPENEKSQSVSEEVPETDGCTESNENQTETTEMIPVVNKSDSCTEGENQSDSQIDEDIFEENLTENVQSISGEEIEDVGKNVTESDITSEKAAGDIESASKLSTGVGESTVYDEIVNEVVSTPKLNPEQIADISTEGCSEIKVVPILEDALKCEAIAKDGNIDESPELIDTVHTDKNEIIEEYRLSVATNKNVDNEGTIDKVNLSECLEKLDDNEDLKTNIADSVVESTVIGAVDESDEEMVPILALEPEEHGEDEVEPVSNSKTEDTLEKMVKPEVIKESSIEPSNAEKLSETMKDSLRKNQKISSSNKKKSGNSKSVNQADENIVAVTNLEKIEILESNVSVEISLSEKEKIEMEALRKAVESITDVSETVYEEEIDKEINIPEETVVSKTSEIIESDEIKDVPLNDCDKTHEIVESSIEINESSGLDMLDEPAKYNVDKEMENNKPSLGTSPDSSQTVTESDSLNATVSTKEKDSKTKTMDKPKRHRKTISESKLEELSINVEVSEKDKAYSPKITIKSIKVPDEEVSTTSNSDSDIVKGSLKMTITKQSDKMHSILKICDPENSETVQETEEHVPKLKIKPIIQPVEQHSPKMSTRSSKHLYSPTSSTQRSSSPRITIKPVLKPDKQESMNPLKIKIGVSKSDEKLAGKYSAKPVKSDEEVSKETILSPKKVVIKPVLKPTEETVQVHSPRITIKPIPKKEAEKEASTVTKLNIKLKKVDDDVDIEQEKERSSPKITIKPIVKPQEPEVQAVEADDEGKGRIVLKINKGNLPTSSKESKKREHQVDDDKLEKVKITKGNSAPLSTKDSKKREHSLDDDKSEKVRIIRASPTSTKDSKKREHLTCDDKTEKIKTIKASSSTPNKDSRKRELSTDDEKSEKVKISKVNTPSSIKETKKREHLADDDKSEKLAKITVKFSKGGGHPHIVQQTEEMHKRAHEEQSPEKHKRLKVEPEPSIATRTRHKEGTVEVSPEKSKQKEASKDSSSDDTRHKDLGIETSPEKSEVDSSETFKLKVNDSEVSSSELRVKHEDPNAETPNDAKRAKKDKDAEGNSPLRSSGKVEDDVKNINIKLDSPIVISEDSRSQDSGSCIIIDEPKETMVVESQPQMTSDTANSSPAKVDSTTGTPTSTPTPIIPRKRGRPRKVPLQVREEFKDSEDPSSQKKDTPKVHDSGRPKRSCRGQSARDTLGIKPRKPRGPGRGRGSKRGMGNRSELERDGKLGAVTFESMQRILQGQPPQTFGSSIAEGSQSIIAEQLQVVSELNITEKIDSSLGMPVSNPSQTSNPIVSEALAVTESSGNPHVSTTSSGPSEVVMVDEDTRMSADTNSRAQTPAKQVVAPADTVIEESQSSIQSSATTESGKTPSRSNKAPRLEVQEPEGSVISADQLTEYYWNGNGPFMLQEQVAQFLGIKSFKRKYPGIKRRMLEMQERDFIRESGLASEHMCDLGLTAVNSADILDIMYSDFQEKYEEYCKHQRDRQAKELINKQKALSLAASHEKSKADITDQAVQSAAQWNAMFNKTRKEQRRACMDLQTLTVHYPKGKIKQIPRAKVGHYPVALVPGQFTDYYKEFTPTEINNLPFNTMLYEPINIVRPDDSDDSGSDGSDSDSDSSSSSSGSGSDSSSGIEDCKLCKHSGKKISPTK